MAQGSGSAAQTVVVGVMLLCLLFQIHHIDAASFQVGDTSGWTFNTDSWSKGKKFKAGDVLIFNYDPTIHNVVAVNKNGYNSCTSPAGAKVFKSGKDQVKLGRGQNYFICSNAGHCDSGMKIAINAV
ncbi:Basic blue protein-like [Quillaja saponaria]|uniref:Basic blue protein n=1 Tax=Quillaja saponaria TaxID=32244 RepID=A0AAD7PSN9_QUISA|nr:Basic blue protein-like [Quillaja saponaria]